MEGGTSSSDNSTPDLEQQVKTIVIQLRKLKGRTGKKLKKRVNQIDSSFSILIDDAHEAGLDKDD